ncbi:MAG: MerR family transcriptional regulator [Actinobacteria bacterium]|nr:MerR family transcriptional regulator [Actinomycetota bacterium]
MLTVLKSDFPDISISKIRFLETEGLIVPQRARSGYRLFTGEDIERLRLILRAQRDSYLPLRVIRKHLSDGTLADVVEGREVRPSAPDLVDTVDLRDAERPVSTPEPAMRPMSESQLLAATGMDARMLSEIKEADLLAQDELGRYSGESVVICRAAMALDQFGIDKRHWRSFRNAARRETGYVDQAVAHLTDTEQRNAAVSELITAMVELHQWLLRAHCTVGEQR